MGHYSPPLNELEAEARKLDTTPAEFGRWLDDARRFALDYLGDLPDEPAYRLPKAAPQLERSLPELPRPLTEVLNEFERVVLHQGVVPTSGRFMGYVPGGGMPSAAVGDFLAAITNRYAGVDLACPGAAQVENLTVRWLRDLLGFGPEAWGTLQSGGSLATITALVAARDNRPPDQWAQGVIYLTAEAHHCVAKALRTIGLGHVRRCLVATDDEYRLEPQALARHIEADRRAGRLPWMVIASAGTINTGAVDPLAEVAAICRDEHLWFHVDGAYGGFFLLTPQARSLLEPMAQADSVVLDPHKGLFLPYGCGAVLVRDGSTLRRSFAASADYLADVQGEQSLSPADYSPELTRHFRALRLWLSLKLHGRQRFAAALQEKLLLARQCYERLQQSPALEMGPRPQLSCVTFRMGGHGDDGTQRLLDDLLRRGRIHLSSTRLGGRLFLRLCILCLRTHRAEVETAVHEIESAAFLESSAARSLTSLAAGNTAGHQRDALGGAPR
jgi:glutamate/tyrosine decarboxylase-like PLP-dependent enzyme